MKIRHLNKEDIYGFCPYIICRNFLFHNLHLLNKRVGHVLYTLIVVKLSALVKENVPPHQSS